MMNPANPLYVSSEQPSQRHVIHYIAYGILLLSFLVALINVWLKEEITKYAFKIDEAQEIRISLENDIHKLNVQLEELRSPARISQIAKELGMQLRTDGFIEIKAE